MASIQDVVNAAYRIGQSAQEMQMRTMSCADTLKTQASQLAATVQGSRSGEDAVRQVNQAERMVRESAARLLALQRAVDNFIEDIRK